MSIFQRGWDGLLNQVPLARDFRFHLTPAPDVPLSKHVQFLEMTHERLAYSFTAMPFVALAAVGFYASVANATLLGVWGLSYCIGYLFSQKRIRAYHADRKVMADEPLLQKWRPKLMRVAGLHGLALCMPLLITIPNVSFEFTTFWYLTMAAIVAGNATHQTPVLAVFSRFFNCSWNLATLLSVWAYPQHWPFISLAVLMYTFGIYRHALSAHKFFLQQARLEETSNQLAEQFKIAKESAERALQEKNLFLATASHDLRQPVHAMGMLIQAVLHRNKDPALVSPLSDLGSSVRTMRTLFNALLDLSKLESGMAQVEITTINLKKCAREAMALFEAEAQQRGLSLRLHLPTQATWVQADPNLLSQVLINLLQNALRYTPSGGVLLGIRSHGGAWRIEVWDTGIGVAEGSRSNIYSPYFREENAWRFESAGHGLGLSVVVRCAHLMNAQYGVDSRLGEGSRFWVGLPKTDHAAHPQAGALDRVVDLGSCATPVRQLPALNQGHCLIVEDDPQVLEAWKLLLQAWGVHAMFARHGTEAFAIVNAGFQPGVILCDERLRSGESGFEVLQALLQHLPQAHGAMVSGEFSSNALKQAEDEGYLVLRKPVDMELMHSLFTRWLVLSDRPPLLDGQTAQQPAAAFTASKPAPAPFS